MNKIRVLLANSPMMVPDSLRKLIEEQEDMEVVGDCRGPMRILQEVGRTKADVVILAQEGTEKPGLCDQLLTVYPDLTILGVSSDMTRVFTQQLCAHQEKMVVDKQVDIVRAMRLVVSQPCAGGDRAGPIRTVCGDERQIDLMNMWTNYKGENIQKDPRN